jgi:acid phosphatase (class A)
MDSREGKEDLQEVLKLQAAATPEQIARAHWTYNLSVFTFGETFDQDFNLSHFPKTAQFFHELNDLVAHENDFLKNYYKRPHPFQVDSAHVREIVVAPPGYSYPSFHSSRSVVFIHILETLDPSEKSTFHLIAKQVEIDRVLAGEHFPSDIEAGKKLGELIYGELAQNKDFLADVQALKAAEWTPPPPPLKNIQIFIP